MFDVQRLRNGSRPWSRPLTPCRFSLMGRNWQQRRTCQCLPESSPIPSSCQTWFLSDGMARQYRATLTRSTAIYVGHLQRSVAGSIRRRVPHRSSSLCSQNRCGALSDGFGPGGTQEAPHLIELNGPEGNDFTYGHGQSESAQSPVGYQPHGGSDYT
jgi:hypothetical protein